jgi:hypothetical protein
MTKVVTSKELIEEYNSISSKAESFGKWLMKVRIKYKFHRCDEDLYYFPKKPLTVYTMKELFEIYENEIHKHLVHK